MVANQGAHRSGIFYGKYRCCFLFPDFCSLAFTMACTPVFSNFMELFVETRICKFVSPEYPNPNSYSYYWSWSFVYRYTLFYSEHSYEQGVTFSKWQSTQYCVV